ncbi:MAG: hypothetical protein KBD94_11635 [Pyrinomonadaceae bacterium]|nr:hypothetical protein [Pyrinomonadaceae bacterium]
MNRRWIEYSDGPANIIRPDQIYVSLSRRGEILINRKCFEEMERPEAVTLMFDSDTNTIGLRPAPADADSSFRMCEARCGARVVSSRGFIRKHNIRLSTKVRFPTARIEHGVLVLELRFGVPVVRNMTDSGRTQHSPGNAGSALEAMSI